MIHVTDLVLVMILLCVLLSLATSRLLALVKIMALLGIAVSVLPLLLAQHHSMGSGGLLFFQMMILIKGVLIPGLLYFAVKRIAVYREIEPIIGYHASLFAGLLIILLAVFITEAMPAVPAGNELLMIAAITASFTGLFLMMSRRKAITQVIGYLMLENGIYMVGTALTKGSHISYVVEFGVLLDLLVAVMVMGIILNNIKNAFDDIDTDNLNRLRD
jgi:hydrogenase-4 component E